VGARRGAASWSFLSNPHLAIRPRRRGPLRRTRSGGRSFRSGWCSRRLE
jgi:hypothetical protein